MNQALMRIMEPELKEATQRAERETKSADIKLLVKNMRRFHVGDDDIRTVLMEDYGLSEEETLSYL